jgi:hypothetical protein
MRYGRNKELLVAITYMKAVESHSPLNYSYWEVKDA